MRTFLVVAAIVVGGIWLAARHLPTSDDRAQAAVTVRAQEILSVSLDTPRSPRDERRLPIAELRGLLATRPGDLLDADKLDGDRRALEAALRARGFLAATVAPASITFATRGGAYVVFDIERGPMFRIGKIRITGPGEADAGVVTLSSGDDAVASRIERARQTLADVLSRGAGGSRVELFVHEDRETATVDVELSTSEVSVMRSPRSH